MYCQKHSIHTDILNCPKCEYENHSHTATTVEKKADGIVSYFESPLALREQYKAEMKEEPFRDYRFENGVYKNFPTPNYSNWLERKLCNGKGS